MSNIDQERAKYAYGKVKDVVDNHENLKGKYSTRAVKLPAMILNNGLTQALVFLFSNENADDKSYKLLLSHIRTWYGEVERDTPRLYTCPEQASRDNEKFVEHVVQARAASLSLLTSETLAIANWLKRFTEGMIGKGEGE